MLHRQDHESKKEKKECDKHILFLTGTHACQYE